VRSCSSRRRRWGEEEGAGGAQQQQHDVLAVDDDDGGGDAGVESPMSTSLNLTTHQLVRETKAGSTCADKWLAEVLERAATCARRRIHSFFGAAHGKSAAATASLASVPSAPRFWQLFRRGTRRH